MQAKPVIGAGYVYFISVLGTLYCADENSGQLYVSRPRRLCFVVALLPHAWFGCSGPFR